MKNETAKTAPATKSANTFSRKIGNTTFLVSVAFSEKSSERIEDKIMRLVAGDYGSEVVPQCN